MPDLAELQARIEGLPLSPRALVVGVLLAAAVIVGAVAGLQRGSGATSPSDSALPRARPPATATTKLTTGAGAGSGPASGGSTTGDGGTGDGSVVVDVAGAVARPGVYPLPSGSRITDAIAAAGGAGPDADVDQVNLAAKVSDGMRIYVPRHGEVVPATAAAGTPTEPVDINTASVDELDQLPGVGPALAQAIADYRAQHGRFSSVDDLGKVKGIGPSKLAAIRPKVRV